MEGDLVVRKVFIDSRFRAEGENEDLTFNLPQMIECPTGTVAYIDEITVPHSWTSIGDGNRYLYLAERILGPTIVIPDTYVIRRLDIPFGNYDGYQYKAALTTALNTNLHAGVSATYTVDYNPNTHKCTITAPSIVEIHFLTDREIELNDLAHYLISKNNAKSGNGTIRNLGGGVETNAQNYSYSSTFETGFLDFLRVHNLYVFSNLAANLNTIGPNGQTGILAKCPVNQSYGTTIHERISSGHDYVDIGRQSLSQIKLSLRDAYSKLINLEKASWSCTICFRIKE